MHIEAVEERDNAWEDHGACFRVYLFSGGDQQDWSWAVETYDVREADVLEVVQWATDQAGIDRLFAVALVVQGSEDLDPVSAQRGLVWLLGLDVNGEPINETQISALRAMHARRTDRRDQA
jgi:hypothetical protein